MKRIQIVTILLVFFTLGNSWLIAQTYNDGPTELKVKVRSIYVTSNIPADAGLNIGGQTIGFDPDEYTFYLGAQDYPNTSALPWQYPSPNPLTSDFDPPGLSTDFNKEIFSHQYGSPVSPKYFSLRLDAWQDNCGSDGVSFLGINCGGNRNNFESSCTDFACGTIAGVGDNDRCNASVFKDTINYRAAGPPCQWNSHGQVIGNCPSNNIYQPVIESFWRYTLGTGTGVNAIDLGTLTIGGRLTHYNSNECYSNNFTSSPGNDVFYKFTINSAIGVTIDLCSPRTLSTFDTYLYLLDATAAIDSSNDDNCGIQSRLSKTICNPGVYYVVVDGKTAGDFGPFELVVYEDSNFTFSATAIVKHPSCAGYSDGTIKVEINGGKPPYSIDWPSPLPDGPDSTGGLSAGTYPINVIDNSGCLTTATAVLIDPLPLTVDVDSTNVTCGGINDGTATANVQGGTGPIYNYVWNTTPVQLTGQTIINLEAGSYTVTVTDVNGCTVSGSTMVVPPPTALAISSSTKTDISCAGANDGAVDITVINGTPPYSFSWSNSDTTEDVSGLSPGSINVVVTDVTGCLATKDFVIEEPPILTSTINSSNVKNVSCNGGSDGVLAVTANGGTQPYTFNWTLDGTTNVGNSEVVVNAEAGDYDILVTDKNGCTTTNSETITEPPAITSSITKMDAGCNGGTGSATLSASGGTPPLTYLWSTQETSSQINSLEKGLYSVIITDANDCKLVDTVSITEYTPMVIQTSETRPTCFGFSDGSIELIVDGDEPITYDWSTGETTASLTELKAGSYDLTVTDANGCSATRSFVLEERGEEDCFSRSTDFVAIPNAFSPNGDDSNDNFDLYAEGTDRIEVQVFDRWGARVYYNPNQQPNTFGQGWDGKINGKDAPTGSYVYLINIDFTDPKVTKEKQRTGTITLIR